MPLTDSVRLAMPEGTVAMAATAQVYELAFSLCQAEIARAGDDLAFAFPSGARLILTGFYTAQAEGGERPRFIITSDSLEWLARQADNPAAANAAKREKAPAAATVAAFWQQQYLPHRANLVRSAMDSRLMAGRWKNHIRDFFGRLALEQVTEYDFERYVAMMRARPGFGDTTILHCLVDLRRMWGYARRTGAVSRDFPGREAIRELRRTLDNEKKCYLDADEAALLVETAWRRRLNSRLDHDIYCYIILGLGLGLRAGEIHKLTSQAVERRIIERTKNGRSRFVHFDFGPVRAMLAERLRLYPPAVPDEPLFKALGPNAKNRTRQSVPRKYYALIRELGFNDSPRRAGLRLEKIDFHALRHTFATLAAMRGVDHLTLMRLMGHKSPAMTLRYIEIADAHQARCQEIAMRGIFPKELEGTEAA